MTRWIFLLAALALAGCERTPPAPGPQYADAPTRQASPLLRFAVHPLHNPRTLSQRYQPLIDHLNRRIDGVHFQLEASRDYQAYEAKLRAREAEFLLPNPWQTLEARKVGYSVIAMAGEVDDFRGIFIVRKDSGIRRPSDLRGKVVSYPSPTALAACILPQHYLHGHGLDVNRDIENRYVGSQESAIMNVYLKQADAGATWPPPWRAFQKEFPQEAAQLHAVWETSPLINNSVMARDDVPAELRTRVLGELLDLAGSPEGRAILAGMETARFQPAADGDYARVRDFIERFEREVRPVEARR